MTPRPSGFPLDTDGCDPVSTALYSANRMMGDWILRPKTAAEIADIDSAIRSIATAACEQHPVLVAHPDVVARYVADSPRVVIEAAAGLIEYREAMSS